MLTHVLLLILGLSLIIGGGNYVTNGSVAIADKFKLSPLLIGLTVVAFGSSTPDLVVTMISTLSGKTALAIGNILGAVIFDMLLAIGIMALIKPIKINKSTLWCDMPLMIFGSLILLLCGEARLFDKNAVDGIDRIEGILMLVCFAVFLIYTIRTAKKPEMNTVDDSRPEDKNDDQKKPMPIWLACICIVGGLVALVYGGQWTVDAASYIAKEIGMSEALIGLTIVGVGGSLPDLATSAIAAMKGQNGIALGNVIGSCIMDILFVLGTCAVVHPLASNGISVVDFATLAGSAVLIWVMGMLGRNHTIGRSMGAFLVILYVAYIIYLIFAR